MCQFSSNYRASNFPTFPYIFRKFCARPSNFAPPAIWRRLPWNGLFKLKYPHQKSWKHLLINDNDFDSNFHAALNISGLNIIYTQETGTPNIDCRQYGRTFQSRQRRLWTKSETVWRSQKRELLPWKEQKLNLFVVFLRQNVWQFKQYKQPEVKVIKVSLFIYGCLKEMYVRKRV